MRHRKLGRRFGRSASHRKAMLRNLASSLFLTERDAELDENEPKVKGRIVTTMPKAKEVRPLVERCVTIARRSLKHQVAAEEFATDAKRGSDAWKAWRSSENYSAWNAAIAPAVAARRRVLQLLGDKKAVGVVFNEIAPRFADRPGGYTRIMKLAQPRLGDAGQQVVLEFVGVRDRLAMKSERPSFDTTAEEQDAHTRVEPKGVEVEAKSATADSTAAESTEVIDAVDEASAEATSSQEADESSKSDA